MDAGTLPNDEEEEEVHLADGNVEDGGDQRWNGCEEDRIGEVALHQNVIGKEDREEGPAEAIVLSDHATGGHQAEVLQEVAAPDGASTKTAASSTSSLSEKPRNFKALPLFTIITTSSFLNGHPSPLKVSSLHLGNQPGKLAADIPLAHSNVLAGEHCEEDRPEERVHNVEHVQREEEEPEEQRANFKSKTAVEEEAKVEEDVDDGHEGEDGTLERQFISPPEGDHRRGHLCRQLLSTDEDLPHRG